MTKFEQMLYCFIGLKEVQSTFCELKLNAIHEM